MKTIQHPQITETSLQIRDLNGQDALFTATGELLPGQLEGMGHIWYDRTTGQNHKCFRVTFFIDGDAVKCAGPVEIDE